MQKVIYSIAVLSVLSALLLSACQSSLPPDSKPQSPNAQQSVWIAKDLGLKQCEQMSAQYALDSAQKILKQNQINTASAHCADDGMMRTQVCGAPQGKLGVYKIKQAQLGKAQSLGFKQVQARQYQQINCS